MKKDDTPSRPLQMPRFKHLRPAPPDSPIYRRGFLLGAVVLGSKFQPPRPASAPEKRAVPEERP